VTQQAARFELGDRVKVRRDPDYGPGPWPDEPTGTIAQHPLAPEGQPWVETVTRLGLRRTYWVQFDRPQRDTEGDGPYPESEVLDYYLVPWTAG
jgi:hypothetical protein